MSRKKNSGTPGRLSRGFYRLLYPIVKRVYPRISVEGLENLPEGPCVVVGNHAQIHGPLAGELCFPGPRAIWCAAQMMSLKEVPAYAFDDFWSRKPRLTHPFYRILSYIIAPLAVCIFNNAHTLPVYHDMRVLVTFRATLDALTEGKRVIIFPECYEPYNHIVYRFQDRFVDIARMYSRKTGKELKFVPLYVAPALRTMVLGAPVTYDSQNPLDAERERICSYLMDAVTDLAVRLPKHRVVPYVNVSAKYQGTNLPEKGSAEHA